MEVEKLPIGKIRSSDCARSSSLAEPGSTKVSEGSHQRGGKDKNFSGAQGRKLAIEVARARCEPIRFRKPRLNRRILT